MKYHIEPEQAEEITEKQFYSLFHEMSPRVDWANYYHKKMDIIKMIEFLDRATISGSTTFGWSVHCYGVLYEGDKLVDTLWEAVKDDFTSQVVE